VSDQRLHWSVDRRVNAGHLLSTVTILAAALAYAFHISARIDVIEVRQEALEQRLDHNDLMMLESLGRIERRLERLADQLTRKADKR